MNIENLWNCFNEDEKDEITRYALQESKILAEWLVGKEEDAQELVDAINTVLKFVSLPTTNHNYYQKE